MKALFQGLAKTRTKKSRFMGVSMIAHVAAVGLFAVVTAPGEDTKEKPTRVEFFSPPPPPPPPPAGGGGSKTRKIPKKTLEVKKFQQPTEIPQEVPQPKSPEPEAESPKNDGGVEGGVEGGVKGGVVGGTVGGVLGGVLGGTGSRLDWDGSRMSKPVMLSEKRKITYTEKALENDVEGVMIVKCVIMTDGSVKYCQVIQGLRFMDREVVETLEGRKYEPIKLDGQPVEVSYTFKVRLNLPK
jgi:protein TonB